MIRLAIIVVAICLVSASQAQQRSYYDRRGSFAGSASQHGNLTSAYDRNGHFAGSAIRNSDGTTSFYDRNGRFTGSARR
jgi:hypothetical protein